MSRVKGRLRWSGVVKIVVVDGGQLGLVGQSGVNLRYSGVARVVMVGDDQTGLVGLSMSAVVLSMNLGWVGSVGLPKGSVGQRGAVMMWLELDGACRGDPHHAGHRSPHRRRSHYTE